MRPGLSLYITEPEWNRGVHRSARLNPQPVGDPEPELEEDVSSEDNIPLNQLFQVPEGLQARLYRQEPSQRSSSIHVEEPGFRLYQLHLKPPEK